MMEAPEPYPYEKEWIESHWIYEVTVTVGENVYWGYILRSEGLPWEQVG